MSVKFSAQDLNTGMIRLTPLCRQMTWRGGYRQEIMKRQEYCLKEGYQSRTEYLQFDDRPHTMEWQLEVYLAARALFEEQSLRRVVDIGCGAAFKLMHFFRDAETIGLELEPNLSYLRATYPDRDWRASDLSRPPTVTGDLVIGSDVIEHLVDPDELLRFTAAIRAPWSIISTPERDAVSGRAHVGPPENPHHVREWNSEEFPAYVSTFLPVRSAMVIDLTQLVICGRPDE